MSDDRMSQEEINNLIKMLNDDPDGLEKTKEVAKGDKYICIFCHKIYRIATDRHIPSLKFKTGCGCGCYVWKVSDIKKRFGMK